MLTRALFALALICGLAASASAEDAKVLDFEEAKATAVLAWLSTADWARVSPGSAATICGQLAALAKVVAATRVPSSTYERVLMVAHTAE